MLPSIIAVIVLVGVGLVILLALSKRGSQRPDAGAPHSDYGDGPGGQSSHGRSHDSSHGHGHGCDGGGSGAEGGGGDGGGDGGGGD